MSIKKIDTLTRGQRELAHIGSAPELIAVTQIPPDWTVAVLEFIDGDSYYDSIYPEPTVCTLERFYAQSLVWYLSTRVCLEV